MQIHQEERCFAGRCVRRRKVEPVTQALNLLEARSPSVRAKATRAREGKAGNGDGGTGGEVRQREEEEDGERREKLESRGERKRE